MTLWYRHTDSSLLFNEAQCHNLGTDILYTRSSMIVCDESNISLKNCNVLKSLRTKRHSCECHEGGMGSELGMDHQHQQRNSTYEVDGFLLSKGEQDQKTR